MENRIEKRTPKHSFVNIIIVFFLFIPKDISIANSFFLVEMFVNMVNSVLTQENNHIKPEKPLLIKSIVTTLFF